MTKNTAEKVTQAVEQRYTPSAEERRAVYAHFDRKKQRPPSPSLKVAMNGSVAEMSFNHPNVDTGQLLLMNALAATEPDFVNGLLVQLANASSKGNGAADEAGLNFMLSVIKSVQPRDELETLLAAQMAAVHVATLTFARRLANVNTIQQQDSAERALNKLARTFTSQLEALKRYRTGGEQKVTVEHVHVHEGGQAIVGHVDTRGTLKWTDQPHASSHAKKSAMRCKDAKRHTVSIAGNAERSMSHAWW